MAAEAVRTRVDMGDLKDLEPLSKRLNAATDQLNQSLQIIQDKLNALGVGVEVWLEGDSLAESEWRDILGDFEEPSGRREFDADELGYARLGDQWALVVRRRRYVEGNPQGLVGALDAYEDAPMTDRKPLLRAARHLRIAAVDLIPKLIDAIKDQAQNALDRIEQAKKIADSLK